MVTASEGFLPFGIPAKRDPEVRSQSENSYCDSLTGIG